MSIETKFKVGDTVFTIDPKTLKIKDFEVAMVSAYATAGGTSVNLSPREDYGYGNSVDEALCFPDEESLIAHITKP